MHVATCLFFTMLKNAGGIHGVGYVMKEHRGKDLFRAACAESYSKMLGKKEVLIGERKFLSHPFEKLGTSNYVVLNKLSENIN